MVLMAQKSHFSYENSPFKSEIRLILINAITVGGFNIINPFEIQRENSGTRAIGFR